MWVRILHALPNNMTYPSKFTSKVGEIPEDTKYLVMYNDTYGTDNGYPEDGYRTVDYIRVVSFNSEELMLEWIKSETTHRQWNNTPRNPKDILIFPMNAAMRVEVETKVSAKVSR